MLCIGRKSEGEITKSIYLSGVLKKNSDWSSIWQNINEQSIKRWFSTKISLVFNTLQWIFSLVEAPLNLLFGYRVKLRCFISFKDFHILKYLIFEINFRNESRTQLVLIRMVERDSFAQFYILSKEADQKFIKIDRQNVSRIGNDATHILVMILPIFW